MDYLKEKLGPLPVWGWGVILGVAIVGYMWLSQRNSTVTTNTSRTEDTSATDPLSGWRDSDGIPVSSVIDNSIGQNAATETNAQWVTQGTKFAIEQGFLGAQAQSALQKYLSGTALTSTERSIIDRVIAAIGTPPDGIDNISGVDEAGNKAETVSAVKALYLRLLGRTASEQEAGTWANRTTDTAYLEQRIASSAEGVRYQIGQLYVKYLGRKASAPEVNLWYSRYRGGMTMPTIEQRISSSAEAKRYSNA